MRMIDAHQHYWSLGLGHNNWPTPHNAAIFRDFGPQDLKPELLDAGISATVLVQAAPNIAETEFLLALSEKEDTVAAVVGWVDICAPTARADLERLKRYPKFKGIRPMLQGIDDTFYIMRPEAIETLALLPALDLRFDALVQSRHLPVISALADRLPALQIVIDHGAKPGIANSVLEPWAADMTALAKRANVCVKLSGLVTEAGCDWTADRLQPYAHHIIDAFGPDRVMFGSDWPVINLHADYQTWWKTVHALTSGLDDDGKRHVFGETAIRFYGLTR